MVRDSSMKDRPFLAITMGDPAGIGAEVVAKSFIDAQVYERCNPFVVGNTEAIKDALRISKSNLLTRSVCDISNVVGEPGTIDVLDIQNLDFSKVRYGCVSKDGGRASVEWILKAGELAASGQVQAVVTAPINKEACKLAGFSDIGHMEIFQSQTNAKQVATMLKARQLRVVHLTTHKSIRTVADFVTKENVLAKICLTEKSFKEWGFPKPRIGVSALNPHASDGGLLGDEEELQITPAVKEAISLGINAVGPIPGDTIFNQAIDGKFDAVLAMYHDQGHIPIKVHDWAKSVSVNLGLPFVRTSVDHGTAFDIAGKGFAESESLREAMKVAISLASDSLLP